MVECSIVKYFLIFLLCISKTNSAPTTIIDETESTTKSIRESTTPISDLIQIQTAAIKKIISTSVQSINSNQNSNKPKCEDIESELKETFKKQTGQDIQFQEIQLTENQEKEKQVNNENERGDITNDDAIIVENEEKQPIPIGRNLFNFYRQNDEITTPSTTTTTTSNYNYSESQNVILIPCIKQIGNRRFDQDVIQQQQQQQQHEEQEISSTTTNPEHETDSIQQNENSYVLQKVYSPNGYFLYYMYRLQNSNPYPYAYSAEQVPTTTQPQPTTTTVSTTSTSVSPPPPPPPQVQEPVYAERLKFVIQMPYTEPQQMYPQNVKFDQYAYYPPDMQPGYMNAAQAYRPTYHMIRTLVIPNEYLNENTDHYNGKK